MLEEWLKQWIPEAYLWVMKDFLVVFTTLIVAYIAKVVLDRIEARTQQTKTLWDDALISSVKRPLKWFIWLVGLSVAIEFAIKETSPELVDIVDAARKVGVNVIVTWFLVLFIRKAEENLTQPEFTKNKPMDITTVTAVGKLLRVSVIITAVLFVLQTFGVSISGVLAFGGIGGLAVGFAAKDLLANFFGGLMVYLDRQFSVGEWIRSPDQEIEGTVEEIGWRLTRIRTFDKRLLYVPNSTFTHISVENPSRMTNRRIYETIGVRYDDASKLPGIVDDVRAMLEGHEDIDHSQTLIVNFNSFGASSLDFFVYTFTKTTNWIEYHEIKQRVLFSIFDIIEQHGAECAFPTSTLHVPEVVRLQGVVPENTSK
ncbi:mechanosensitive ion channel family protein [Aurantivibrio plasticivorans]